jgi:hypothetical protein
MVFLFAEDPAHYHLWFADRFRVIWRRDEAEGWIPASRE